MEQVIVSQELIRSKTTESDGNKEEPWFFFFFEPWFCVVSWCDTQNSGFLERRAEWSGRSKEGERGPLLLLQQCVGENSHPLRGCRGSYDYVIFCPKGAVFRHLEMKCIGTLPTPLIDLPSLPVMDRRSVIPPRAQPCQVIC